VNVNTARHKAVPVYDYSLYS